MPQFNKFLHEAALQKFIELLKPSAYPAPNTKFI